MGLTERIQDIEAEMARTQKNKATEHHLGLLKAKLAKLRHELIDSSSKGKGGGEGFEVLKAGDARIALIGFPSVGKSTLLSMLTKTESQAAAYEFTTLTCIPGVIEHKGARLQLLDLPGIIEGAASGVGRGKQVIAVARTADLVMILLDASKADQQRPLLEKELEACGIRLNKAPVDISITIKPTGGIHYSTTVVQPVLTEKLVSQILHEYRIFNAHVLLRQECETVDDFIDAVVGDRVYLPCLYVVNKIDCVYIEDVERLARIPNHFVISCNLSLNLEELILVIWRFLSLTRVYTKKPGSRPDLSEPIILRKGKNTVKSACGVIHKDLLVNFKYALVWGTSAKHYAQRVGLSHVLQDEDVIQLMKN